MVPEGSPFFLYRSSFHLNKAAEMQTKLKATAKSTTKTAIDMASNPSFSGLTAEREKGEDCEGKWRRTCY